MASILLVDDNPDTCIPLARLLEYMGHHTDCVSSGADALGYLKMVRPNLVVLDVSMPVMDGLTVLREMRQRPDLARLPVVMYTALSDEKVRTQALELGASDVLIKGLTDLGELQAKITQYMA
jgi:CheY-like chemotaxis protein